MFICVHANVVIKRELRWPELGLQNASGRERTDSSKCNFS